MSFFTRIDTWFGGCLPKNIEKIYHLCSERLIYNNIANETPWIPLKMLNVKGFYIE
jgi:hypothetical protein